jgi:hypothetical protein
MPDYVQHRVFILILATIAWGAAMQFEASCAQNSAYPEAANCYYSGTPILDLELSSSPTCFVNTVQLGNPANTSHNAQVFSLNTWMDFAFIFLYWSAFVAMARTQAGRMASAVIALISLSALGDVLENVRLLFVLHAVRASGHATGLLPRDFSTAKWALLGLALFCLGALIFSGTGWLSKVLGAVVVIAGGLTLAGIFQPKAMTLAGAGFLALLLLAAVKFWPYTLAEISNGIEYGYLLRFPIIAGALLAVVLPAAFCSVPSIFVGLFDGRGFWSFTLIVWAAFQLAWTIMINARLVLVYAPERFERATPIVLSGAGAPSVSLYGLLAAPVVVTLFYGTATPGTGGKILATTLGLGFALGVLFLTAKLYFSLERVTGARTAIRVFPWFGLFRQNALPDSRFWTKVDSWINRLPNDVTAGYLENGHLRSGHKMAATSLLVFLLVYGAMGVVLSPAWMSPERQPSALFFLLFLLTVFTWIFSGAAFFLDRLRLPVLTTLLAVSVVTGLVHTDHEFDVRDSQTPAPASLRAQDVIHDWEIGPRFQSAKQKDTVTIVATAGGGIRAAAWTAEVMAGLQARCGANLSSTVLMVSSVSGGSVGSMFVVGPYASGSGEYPATQAELEKIEFNATRSSLSAVGWGLAYPDLARTTPFLGSLVPQFLDRGWSLENSWSTAWRDGGQRPPMMREWRNDVAAGTRPAVIFNATVSETGERFLVASTDISSEGTEKFFELFPNADIRVSTGARLSATFPYVSPLTRPSQGPIRYGYHVGDGGYYDNSGLLSTIEWLDDAGAALNNYNVLLIIIDAKPGATDPGSVWPWQKQLVGPLETLVDVRTASQQLRDSFDLQMATGYLAAKNIRVVPEKFLFASNSPSPLSWHLTPGEIQEIGDAWKMPENMQAQDAVASRLACPAGQHAAP